MVEPQEMRRGIFVGVTTVVRGPVPNISRLVDILLQNVSLAFLLAFKLLALLLFRAIEVIFLPPARYGSKSPIAIRGYVFP